MATESPLPFEPKRKRSPKKTAQANQPTAKATGQPSPQNPPSTGIPEVVSRRMVRRIAVFSGTPTALGVASFFVSYYVVSQGLFKLPNTAVLLVSLGCFGLGVLGLSYGVLSASWDEEVIGSWWGGPEFSINIQRLWMAWKESRLQKNNQSKSE
jgi:hypothetical protein